MNAEERRRIDGMIEGLAISEVVAKGAKTPKEIREGIANVLDLAREAAVRADYARLLEYCGRK
jgi:hypothetical protein